MKHYHFIWVSMLFMSLTACQGSETHVGGITIHHGYDTTTTPVLRTYKDIDHNTLWQHCIDICLDLGFSIHSAQDGTIRTKKMDQEGVSWCLVVNLGQDNNGIIVESYMEITRHTDAEERLIENVVDHYLDLDLEEQLEDLEKDYQEGVISFHTYTRERETLEMEIAKKEAERRAAWKKKDQVRIQRVTYPGRMFLPCLDDRVLPKD